MDEKKPPVDILDEILNRPEEPRPSPAGHSPGFGPHAAEDGLPPPPAEKKAPPMERLLPWLCALLGGTALAALVLGVQLVSVNARLDGVQAAVGEIQTMDELRKENEKLQSAYDSQQEQSKSLQEAYDRSQGDLYRMTVWYDNDYTLNYLEQFLRNRDYLMAGAVVVDSDVMFNRNTPLYTSVDTWQYLTPANEKRYLELKEELFQESGFMDLTQEGDGSGYVSGVPIIDPGAFGQEERAAAQSLWRAVRNYAIAPDGAAQGLAAHYDSLREWGDRGLFKASTMEVLEQLKDDLIRRGFLVEAEDGSVRALPGQFSGSTALD